MDFYQRIQEAKKTLKLTNEDLGNVIGKKPDAFRLAIIKKSLKHYDIKELNNFLDCNDFNNEIRKDKVIDCQYTFQAQNDCIKDKMIAILETALKISQAEVERLKTLLEKDEN